MGAHRHGQGMHLSSPGKVEKCYRVKKNSISDVSLNGLDATFPRRKIANEHVETIKKGQSIIF